MKLTDYLSSVEDPCVVGRCKHKLSDILLIALITYLCGGEDYTDMHQLAEERAEELSPLLKLPNGLPSVDTFERVLGRINPASLLACLNVYGATLVGELKGKQVSLDGKTIEHQGARKIALIFSLLGLMSIRFPSLKYLFQRRLMRLLASQRS